MAALGTQARVTKAATVCGLGLTRLRLRPTTGLRTALFYTRLYDRSLRTGLAIISPAATNPTVPMAKSIRAAEIAINNWYDQTKFAA
jgi:hypothetical protein